MNREVSNTLKEERKNILKLIHEVQAPHVASALSCVEILEAVYEIIDIEKIRSKSSDRDIVILSKGHAIAAQLAVMKEKGLIDDKVMYEYCTSGSFYFENTSPFTPHIECATGSLGQGVSYGLGNALGQKIKGIDSRTYVIVGDGELNEGQCWEAFELSAQLEVDNLVVIIDRNGLAGIDSTCSKGDIEDKLKAFGLETVVVDGHDVNEIKNAIYETKQQGKPKAIVCNTIKGKGISFMENNNVWHYRPVSDEDFERALLEIES